MVARFTVSEVLVLSVCDDSAVGVGQSEDCTEVEGAVCALKCLAVVSNGEDKDHH